MDTTRPIVTLLTDFGIEDEYAAVMKGVLLSRNRDIAIVDLSHAVSPQNVVEAAHILSRSYQYFPEGSVHLVVVDPGVGSAREIIALKVSGHFFIGPDNGLFSFLLQESLRPEVCRVDKIRWGGLSMSSSFHGRDIMAPVAAHIACSLSLEGIGEKTPINACKRNAPLPLQFSTDSVRGAVVHVDHFGNLCTNIPRSAMQDFPLEHCRVTVGSTSIRSVSTSYYQQKEGVAVALFDSHDFLEIAVNQGNASNLLRIRPGALVLVQRS